MLATNEFFGTTYDDARARFLRAAQLNRATASTHELPGHRGAEGETLTIDTALLGPENATGLIVMSSGTHGPEGFCGSGSQVALLYDTELQARLEDANVALLLVHAVNPYGFSHLRRGNEHNIDLNRNCIDFSVKRPANPDYTELHDLLIPEEWPANQANRQAFSAFISERGEAAYQAAVTLGQYEHPDGMFYGGTERSWSCRTLRDILEYHGRAKCAIAWLDMHTGLGPRGHAEKIHTGSVEDLTLAYHCWGADVFTLGEGKSKAPLLNGSVSLLLAEACPLAARATIALEYGTVPLLQTLDAIRASSWLYRRGQNATAEQADQIRQTLRATFYCDADDWRGMVLAQARTAVVQAICGLQNQMTSSMTP